MMDESQQEMVVRYVLGDLSSPEAERFRVALDRDPELRAYTRDTEATFAALALAAPPKAPPSSLPTRILKGGAEPLPKNVVSFAWLYPWALAACLAVMSFLFATQLVRSRRELATLQNKFALTTRELTDLQSQDAHSQEELVELRAKDRLSQIRIATLQAQVDNYARTGAVVVWNKESQSGLIQFDNLPPPKPGKNYQLWVIDPKMSEPVSAGLVPAGESGLLRVEFKPVRPVASAAKFAVSVEEAGGSQVPRGEIVLLGQ